MSATKGRYHVGRPLRASERFLLSVDSPGSKTAWQHGTRSAARRRQQETGRTLHDFLEIRTTTLSSVEMLVLLLCEMTGVMMRPSHVSLSSDVLPDVKEGETVWH